MLPKQTLVSQNIEIPEQVLCLRSLEVGKVMTMDEIIKFSDLTECPFCGSAEFFRLNHYQGKSTFYERFDGKEAYDNSQMYDSLSMRQGQKVYCADCKEYLGNTKTDTISKKAHKALTVVKNND